MHQLKVAIFDFDGTLFPEETFPLMMNHLKQHPKYKNKYRRFITKILPIYVAYKTNFYPEQKMKEYSMRTYISSFKKASAKEINQFFFEIGSDMRKNLNASVLERIDLHRKNGYYIMLVSGAFLPLLQAVTKDIPFDSIIGTSVPLKNDLFDKNTPIIHIHGARKKDKIFAQLANDSIDWENSFAYGDSYSDLDVLELVGNPVAVKPEPRLLQIAEQRQWEVI
ncbi:HAD-IB family hydrolase [Anaerobacillus arseniciselenatis]|uniref:HAD family hydrolase n=1 Tax=Anaerobacillus arseniciselenatis TaxID=85682 RepID=UPI0030811DEA